MTKLIDDTTTRAVDIPEETWLNKWVDLPLGTTAPPKPDGFRVWLTLGIAAQMIRRLRERVMELEQRQDFTGPCPVCGSSTEDTE